MKRLARPAIVLLAALLLLPLFSSVAEALPPATPTPIGPLTGTTVQANPVFSWSPVAPVAFYQVQISTSPTFTGGMLNDVGTVNTNFTPTQELPQTVLYWRVIAVNAANELSPWSSTIQFTKTAPTAPNPTSPADQAVLTYPNQPVTLKWDPLVSAKSYEIEIALDQAFTAPLVLTASTTQVAYTLTTALNFGSTYYWHVRGVSGQNQPTQFSPVRRFSTVWNSAPQLVSPPDLIANPVTPPLEDVVLVWNWLAGASLYELQVSTDINFNTLVINTGVKGTKYTPSTHLANRSYFWRVRGRTPGNITGDWSQVWAFSKAWPAPPYATTGPGSILELLAPANGTTVTVPTFKWKPYRNASLYEVQMGEDPAFGPSSYVSCFTNHTEITAYSGCGGLDPAPDRPYYWRVRPIDGPNNITGIFSNNGVPWTFQYTIPAAVLASPANGTTTATPILTWNKIPLIGRYRVTILRDDNQAVVTTADTYNNSFVPQISWQDPSVVGSTNTFRWYIQGMDYPGRLASFPSGGYRTFTLSPLVAGASPNPLAGPYVGDHIPPLKWQPVTGAAYYNVFYALTSSSSYATLATGLVQPAYAHLHDNVVTGDYKWFVQAHAGDGALLSSGSLGLFSETSMPPATITAPAHCAQLALCSTLTDTPIFTWTEVPGATHYLVTLAGDPNFTTILFNYSTHYNRMLPTESLPETQAGQATYWFVRPCWGLRCALGPEFYPPPNNPPISAFRKQSPPVVTLTPGVPVPNPQSPPPNPPSVPDQVSFVWEDYLKTNTTQACVQANPPTSVCPTQEAMYYNLQVSQLADFSILIDNQFVDDVQYTPMIVTYPEGPIFWRVRAVDQSNNVLSWSVPRLVNKVSAVLTPTTPANNAVLTSLPTFGWNSQAFASSYELEVYSNPSQPLNLANRVLPPVITPYTGWTPTSNLPPGQYGWRIRRLDADVRPGPWSANDNTQLMKFTYNGTAATLTSPANGTIIGTNSILLQWAAVPGVNYYIVQTSVSPVFASFVESPITFMTSYAPTAVYPNNQYYWRVLNYDAYNNLVGTSATRSFFRGTPPPTAPGAPLSVVAVPGDSRATVSWAAPASDGGSPILSYAVTASPGGGTCGTTGALTCQVPFLTNGTSYTFTVRATNSVGTGPPSASSNAVIPRAVPSAPTNAAAVAGNTTATVTWTASASAGGSPITSYTVTASPGGATCTWTVGPLTCTVTGLTNTVAYTFTVRANNAIGPSLPSAPSNSVTPTSADWFHSLVPARILDSRPAEQVGPYASPWGPNVIRDVQVAGVGGVPGGADAVVLNVTATGPTASSYLTIWPAGQAPAVTSSLNWTAGQVIPNAVTVKVGAGGKISVYNANGNVDVVIDVVGYYDSVAGDGYNSLAPARVLDSRAATQVGPYSSPWNGGTSRDVQITGLGGVPAGVDAVVLNVTATGPTASSFLTIWPAGQPRPTASSHNFIAGQVIPNAVTVKLGTGGKISVFNFAGNVDVVVDVVGYFTVGSGAKFHPLTPARIQDSHAGTQVGPYNTPWGPNVIRDVKVTNIAGVPSNAVGVLLNVTASNQTSNSYLTIWPAGQAPSTTSSLNWAGNGAIANAVTAKVGNVNGISVYNQSGNVHVVADVNGFYL